jgi:lipopolysaccharide/colanic/teichoic acid biosynthesis glycosyltransferase
MMKRLFDIIISVIMLILTLPVWILIALAVRLDGRGSLFYCSPRVGKHGRVFRMIKFRTMSENGYDMLDHQQRTQLEEAFKLEKDPRVTRSGRWLRQWSLDELPQLLNVMYGDMSLVGPRPKLPEEIGLYGDRQQELLSVLPGITGYWQVYRTSANSDASMRAMDLHYVRTRTFGLDLQLLFRTVIVIMRTSNY